MSQSYGFAMRLAERLGHVDPSIVDRLPPELLKKWRALAIVDDWDQRRMIVFAYHIYMMLVRCAARLGADIDEDDILHLHDLFPGFPKPEKRYATATQAMTYFAGKYG